MEHLDEVSMDDLHDALDSVEGARPTQRLVAAIAYKNGVTQTELAEWFGTGRRTIYNWLMRLDTDTALEEAVTDANRSGRNRKLSEDDLLEFRAAIDDSPQEAGYDRSAWTPRLVQRHLEEAYDVQYSLPSCRRLLEEAGLSYQPPHAADPDATSPEGEDIDEPDTTAGRWTPQ